MHSKCERSISKYLAQHAEKRSIAIANGIRPPKKHYALVIPAYDEQPDFLIRLSEHHDAANMLLILVINEPIGQTPNNGNQQLIAWLNDNAHKRAHNAGSMSGQLGELAFIVMECVGEHSLPIKQGVGLARKLGVDLAVALIHDELIERPWIYCTDADSHLPHNYFSHSQEIAATCSAMTFDFKHIGGDNSVAKATTIYESQLRFYQKQLKHAGSPYAFCSLGSCMAVSMKHYCQVRGFPKRPAGEDFYLLNKLAKVGDVLEVNDVVIELSARLSERVPFGTGPATSKILSTLEQNLTPSYYNEAIFTELKQVLDSIDALWLDENSTLNQFHHSTRNALEAAGIREYLIKRRTQDKSIEQFRQHFHHWFDAFQTLKFVHRLQASRFPPAAFTL